MDQFEATTEQCLEAAMCAWEAIDAQTASDLSDRQPIWDRMEELRRNIGSPSMRYYTGAIAAQICVAYQIAEAAAGGIYDEAFDWEFVPDFLTLALSVDATGFTLCEDWKLHAKQMGQDLISNCRRHEARTLKLSDRELAAMLAGLRLYQRIMTRSPLMDQATFDIASDDGTFSVLNANEVDGLCERLNVQPQGVAS